MAKEIKDLRGDAEREIGQAAAEFKYLGQLREELVLLKNDLEKNPQRSIKDVKTAIRVVRGRLGRTERYLNRVDLKKDITELMTYLPLKLKEELSKLKTPIEVALNTFVERTSRQQGTLRQGLEALEKEVESEVGAKDPRMKTSLLIRCKQHLDGILNEVNNTITFVAGFEVALGKYKEFLIGLEKL